MDRDMLVDTLRPLVRNESYVNIAIDIDETLAGINKVVIEFLYNNAKGTTYTVRDHTDWDYKNIGSNYVEMMGFYVEAWKNHHEKIPFIGDLEGLRELSQFVLVDLLTTRSIDSSGLTAGTLPGLNLWVEEHGIRYLPLVCSPEKINKLEFSYKFFIDDSPTLADKIKDHGRGLLLLVDKPYNMHIAQSDRVISVADANTAIAALVDALRLEGKNKVLYQSSGGQALLHRSKVSV